MSDFLFHEVSEKEKEKIKKEAKAIMDRFSSKLAKIGKLPEDVGIDRAMSEREEDSERSSAYPKALNSGACSALDREIMFGNAPSKNGTLKGTSDFIVAEKKSWGAA